MMMGINKFSTGLKNPLTECRARPVTFLSNSVSTGHCQAVSYSTDFDVDVDDSKGSSFGTNKRKEIKSKECTKQRLTTFWCDWLKTQPACRILKSDHPECFRTIFDPDIQRETLASLGTHGICIGSGKCSTVLLAEELNNVRGLKKCLE